MSYKGNFDIVIVGFLGVVYMFLLLIDVLLKKTMFFCFVLMSGLYLYFVYIFFASEAMVVGVLDDEGIDVV